MNRSRYRIMMKLGFRNILRNWRHSLATVLAIVSGFAAVALFDGFIANIRVYVRDNTIHRGMLGHVIIEKQDAQWKQFEDPWRYSMDSVEQSFIDSYLDPWRKDGRVIAALRVLTMSGLVSDGHSSAVFIGIGYDVSEGLRMRGDRWAVDTLAGKPLHLAAGPALVMGKGLANRFENGHGFQLSVTTEKSQVNAMNLRASGVTDMILRDIDDRFIALPLPTAQELFDTDRITRVSVLFSDPDTAPGFIRAFKSAAAKMNLDLNAFPWTEHSAAAAAKGGLEILGVFRGLFLMVVLVVAGMSVANTVMKSVNERVREVGALRSYGFRQKDVHFLFSFEGFLLGLFSCLAGIVVTIVASFLISSLGLTFKAGILSTPIPVRMSIALSSWMISAVTMSMIAFVASWVVSWRRSRMVIADSLRYVA